MPAFEDFFGRSVHRLRDFRLYEPNPLFGNPGWDRAELRVLILRLSPYADVQRSTPHLFLAGEVRSALPAAFIDMAFLPEAGDARTFAEAGLPLVIGTQSHRPLADFDLVLVSNSWLLEQVNLPFLLLGSGVPLWAGARGEEWPPIILGGSNASAAHALVTETGDCMADAIFFGEGEGSVGRIARAWAMWKGRSKSESIAAIAARVTGLWPAGSLDAVIRRARFEPEAPPAPPTGADLDQQPILPGPEASTARLSITHGCPCLCSFCFEGHDRKPFREIPAEEILRAARALKIRTGAAAIEVESFNFNTHTGIAVLLEELPRLYQRVNLMSQRVDILARTPGLLDLEIAADKRSFTLGIEGISGRIRSFLHKSLEEQDIREVVKAVHGRRTRELKLFYMLTGRESDDDFDEFVGFMRWMRQVRESADAAPRVVFSFGLLVRMPFTPLRHDAPILDERAWRMPAGRAKSICETHGFEFRLAMNWPEYAATQALALGGHSLHPLLVRLAESGSVTDRGLGPEARESLQQWMDACGDSLAGEKPREHAFAFPFLNDEATRSFLHRQYEEAKAGHDHGYCRHGIDAAERCADCTGCTRSPRRTRRQDEGLVKRAHALAQLMERKHGLKPVHVSARIPREAAGMGPRWIDAWLMRALLARCPDQVDNILSITEAVVDSTGVIGPDVPWFGLTTVSVTAWDTAGLAGAFARTGGVLGAPGGVHGPAAIRSLRIRVELPSELFANPAQRLAEFLRDAHAPVTLSRAEGGWAFAVPEKSLRKRMLLEGRCGSDEKGAVLELSIGTKPFLEAWLDSFGQPGASRRARAEILSMA